MKKPDYRIRPATEADRAQWDPLWQGYLKFYKSSLPDETTDLLWQRILNPEHEIECRVAADNESGKLLGIVHFFPHANTWQENRVCYLNDLFVSSEIRGGGIGEALIEAVVDEARAQNWAEVYWLTQEHNTVARGLYDKVTGGSDGFVTYLIDVASYQRG